MRGDYCGMDSILGVVVGMNISEKAIRAAMLDTVLQQDKRREQILIEALREKNAQVHRINREIKKLATDLLVVQRQIAGLHDALSLELTG